VSTLCLLSTLCRNTIEIPLPRPSTNPHMHLEMLLFNGPASQLQFVNTTGPSTRVSSESHKTCYRFAIMSVHPLNSDTNMIKDLTTHEVGDLSLWIGRQREYHNELCRYTSPLPSVLELLPPASLPVLQLLRFPTPHISGTILGIKPDTFSFLVFCRARLSSKAPAWAQLGRARAYKNLEPVPGQWLGLCSAGLRLKPRLQSKK